MSETELPERVSEFIREHIDSIAKLELLLWLRRTSENPCTVSTASRELRSSDAWVEQSLRELCRSGLLKELPTHPPSFQYGPARLELEEAAQALATVYVQRPLRVIDSIYRRPADKVQLFADAFHIRKRRKDE